MLQLVVQIEQAERTIAQRKLVVRVGVQHLLELDDRLLEEANRRLGVVCSHCEAFAQVEIALRVRHDVEMLDAYANLLEVHQVDRLHRVEAVEVVLL